MCAKLTLDSSCWRSYLTVVGVLLFITQTATAGPINQQLLRSVEGDEPPEEFCYPFEFDNSTTSINLLGLTTVFFKVTKYNEKSWDAFMILDLKERFVSRGYKSVQFVVILPADAALPGASENAQNSTTISTPDNSSNITVINDTEDTEHLTAESVTVVDNCGTLAYTIFEPWSRLEYPYVKAAILSAMFDMPCGTCPSAQFPPHPLYDRPEGNGIVLDLDTEKEPRHMPWVPVADNETSTTEEDSSYLIPIKIIIPSEHVHREETENPFKKFEKFNYLVLKTDDQFYHGHLDNDEPDSVWVHRDVKAGIFPTEEDSTTSPTTVTEDQTETPSMTTAVGDVSSEESFFGFSNPSTKVSVFSSNDITPTKGTTRPVERERVTEDPKATVIYATNNNAEKFIVKQKYRFGAGQPDPRDFDDLDLLRDEVKTYITVDKDKVGETKPVQRSVTEHYEIMLPWLDYRL